MINADDHYAPLWHQLASPANCVTFGLKSDADISATWVGEGTSTRIVLLTPAGSAALELNLPGRHNVMNVLAATAATLSLGVSLDAICRGLQKMQPVAGRLVLRELDDVRVLDDSYNANPTSLKAGLEVLAEYPATRWLILGDMAELGPQSARLHRDAGALARELGVERMFCYGDFAREACESFGEGGEHFGDIEALIESVRGGIRNRPTILIKGSRSMRMERIVSALEAAN